MPAFLALPGGTRDPQRALGRVMGPTFPVRAVHGLVGSEVAERRQHHRGRRWRRDRVAWGLEEEQWPVRLAARERRRNSAWEKIVIL